MSARKSLRNGIVAVIMLLASCCVAWAHYDPELGRWLERDPAEYVDGMNLAEFSGSNPINRIDSTGQEWEFEPEPEPIEKRDPPSSLPTNIDPETRVEWTTIGKWGSHWWFYASPNFNTRVRDCCSLDIDGSLGDRWYWASDNKARKEELWELRREEKYWREWAKVVMRFRKHAEGDPLMPCDLASVLGRLLTNGSRCHSTKAQLDIFTEDMRRHPNSGYRRARDQFGRWYDECMQKHSELWVEYMNLINAYKRGERAWCCDGAAKER